jgi:hypothetical protein
MTAATLADALYAFYFEQRCCQASVSASVFIGHRSDGGERSPCP